MFSGLGAISKLLEIPLKMVEKIMNIFSKREQKVTATPDELPLQI
jgi:hypothetical protein